MPDNRKPLKYGAFPVCRNYTVRAFLRNFAARKWRDTQAGSGVVGASQLCGHSGHIRSCFGRIQARNGRYDVKTFGQRAGRLTASKTGLKKRLTDI